jgi:hypothetical protein
MESCWKIILNACCLLCVDRTPGINTNPNMNLIRLYLACLPPPVSCSNEEPISVLLNNIFVLTSCVLMLSVLAVVSAHLEDVMGMRLKHKMGG